MIAVYRQKEYDYLQLDNYVMKKAITIIALTGSALIIMSSFRVGSMVAMFLLAGQVPGTSIIMSPTETFMLIALVAGFTVARLMTPPLRRLAIRR